MYRSVFMVMLFVWMPALAGCQSRPSAQKADPAVLQHHRDRFVLAEEPDQLVGVIELRDSLTPPDEETTAGEAEAGTDETTKESLSAEEMKDKSATVPTGPVPVNVIAKIGGKSTAGVSASDFPWEKDQATFVIVDPSFDPHEQGHDHGEDHDCPFCNKKASDAQAIVQFLGEDDRVVPVDARALFNLKLDDLIVVQGVAQLQGGVLMINATGLYVRE